MLEIEKTKPTMLYQPTCTNLALVQPKILKIVFILKNLLFELGNTKEMFWKLSDNKCIRK